MQLRLKSGSAAFGLGIGLEPRTDKNKHFEEKNRGGICNGCYWKFLSIFGCSLARDIVGSLFGSAGLFPFHFLYCTEVTQNKLFKKSDLFSLVAFPSVN